MAFTPRKDEVTAVSAEVEKHHDLTDVTKAAMRATFKAIQGRKLWVVAVKATAMLYGPFASENDAYQALAKGQVGDLGDKTEIARAKKEGVIPSLGGEAVVYPLIGPAILEDRVQDDHDQGMAMANKRCKHCRHPEASHNWPGARATCVVRRCSCPGFERLIESKV